MSKEIEQLNRRLGESLGYCGIYPRFAWMPAHEIFYLFREEMHHNLQRFTWADRIGKVWMLAQWRRPTWIDANGGQHLISPEEWAISLGVSFPYPGRGMYYAHPETALPPGVLPNAEMTAQYIQALDQQMTQSYQAHKATIDAEIAAERAADDLRWTEFTQDSNPAFSNFDPGKRGGHVSFGGA